MSDQFGATRLEVCCKTKPLAEDDQEMIALLLGHESVETAYKHYMHADLAAKEKALARLVPVGETFRRFKPGDRLMGFLNGL